MNKAYNGFIHVLAEKDGVKTGSSIEIFVPAVATNAPGKAGCGGAIEATLSAVGLLAAVTVITLVMDKKRKARA